LEAVVGFGWQKGKKKTDREESITFPHFSSSLLLGGPPAAGWQQ
jgi:hypothetical protein